MQRLCKTQREKDIEREETKDTFIKSIERLSSEHRLTQNSMARALGLTRQSFYRRCEKYDVNIDDYTAQESKDTFLKSIEGLSSEHRLTKTSMAKALGLSRATLCNKAKRWDITTEVAAVITAAREEKKRKRLEEAADHIERKKKGNSKTGKTIRTWGKRNQAQQEEKKRKREKETADRKALQEEKKRKRVKEIAKENVDRKALQEEKKQKRVKEIADRKALKEEKKRMATNNTHAKAVEGVSAITNADANEVSSSSSTIVDLEQRVLNNLSEWKDPDPSTNTTWKALQEKKMEQAKSERALHNALTVLNPDGRTFEICHDPQVNDRNKFRHEVLVSEEETEGLSGVFATDGTDLSPYGLRKLENVYPEATSDILTGEMKSIEISEFSTPGSPTSTVQIVGPWKHIIDPTKLRPLLASRIEVAKSGKFGETTVITDNVKGQWYYKGTGESIEISNSLTPFSIMVRSVSSLPGS